MPDFIMLDTTKVSTAFLLGDQDFARLIEETWAKMPQAARVILCSYWEGAKSKTLLNSPLFALCEGMVNGVGLGGHDFNGFRFRLFAQPFQHAVATNDEGSARDLIAHELAHGHYYANGDRAKEPTFNSEADETTYREKYANRTMMAWGFKMSPYALPGHIP